MKGRRTGWPGFDRVEKFRAGPGLLATGPGKPIESDQVPFGGQPDSWLASLYFVTDQVAELETPKTKLEFLVMSERSAIRIPPRLRSVAPNG